MTYPPLTIVHVGDMPTGIRLSPTHSIQLKLSNGLTRLGHLVLNFADRDVARAKSWTGSRKFGRRAVNAALLAFCRHHRPDIVLLGHADMIAAETVAAIREELRSVRVGQWNADPLFEPDNIRRLRGKLDVVDATFVTTAGAPLAALRAGGHAMSFMPNPVDASIEKGRADLLRDAPFDLFYACGNPGVPPREICGTTWNMNDFCTMLASRLPALRMKLPGINNTPHLKAAAYQHALEHSAIGLNISRRADFPLYSSDRLAQIAGNGCVVAMERMTGYDAYFGEDEMLFFSTIDELSEKLAHLAQDRNARMRMGTAGRARYMERFNERAVAAHLLAVLTGARPPEDMPW
ncbi:glycosyltransferase [Acetobacter sp.]|uniref:glycosyltransferase family protein n=1 Tax=Acetobacter sp. TaxID=440 RepID=UPI0039E803E3